MFWFFFIIKTKTCNRINGMEHNYFRYKSTWYPIFFSVQRVEKQIPFSMAIIQNQGWLQKQKNLPMWYEVNAWG